MRKFTDKINESIEDKIPTVKEYVERFTGDDEDGYLRWDTVEHMCKEFARLHVEVALKAASEKATVNTEPDYRGGEWSIVDTDSILNAYPLDNIK
jgi:hypothetical protein